MKGIQNQTKYIALSPSSPAQKMKFPFRMWTDMNKSAEKCGLVHIYYRNH